MSEIDQSTAIDGGGIISGPDGKLSLRRILGLIFAGIGSGMLISSLIIVCNLLFAIIDKPAIVLTAWHAVLITMCFAPGVFMIAAAMFVMKQITTQAISGIVAATKGK